MSKLLLTDFSQVQKKEMELFYSLKDKAQEGTCS